MKKVKLFLTLPQAHALSYAAGNLTDDINDARQTKGMAVSGSRKHDHLILKSLELLNAAIREARQ